MAQIFIWVAMGTYCAGYLIRSTIKLIVRLNQSNFFLKKTTTTFLRINFQKLVTSSYSSNSWTQRCAADADCLGCNRQRAKQSRVRFFFWWFVKYICCSTLFNRMTPLHFTSIFGRTSTCQLLCALDGVDQNAVNNNDKTALVVAVVHSKVDSVRALLEFNVDTSKARVYANTRVEIVQLLQEQCKRSVKKIHKRCFWNLIFDCSYIVF